MFFNDCAGGRGGGLILGNQSFPADLSALQFVPEGALYAVGHFLGNIDASGSHEGRLSKSIDEILIARDTLKIVTRATITEVTR